MKVCFIGHRKIEHGGDLAKKTYDVVFELIKRGADTFLFGSNSEWNTVAWEVVTKLQREYPSLKRVYVRAEYPETDRSYLGYLLESFEETYFPENLLRAGRSVYIKRNQAMINASDVCVFYYDSRYIPSFERSKSRAAAPEKGSKSGTAAAFAYAKQKNKEIINLYTD